MCEVVWVCGLMSVYLGGLREVLTCERMRSNVSTSRNPHIYRILTSGHTPTLPHTYSSFLSSQSGAYLQRNPKHTSPVADTARIVQHKESHSRL